MRAVCPEEISGHRKTGWYLKTRNRFDQPNPAPTTGRDLLFFMKLERLHEYILITVVMAIGVVLAAVVGKSSGSGQFSTVGLVAAAGVMGVLGIELRARIWLLIPICMTITGKLPFLPLPFTVQELAVMSAFGWFLVFKAVKIVRNKPRYSMLDYVVIANLAWMASVFIRNPVGMDSLGTDRVGGHPYFAVIIGALAWWVLSRADLTAAQARRLPIYLTIGTYFDLITGSITYRFPSTVPLLSHFYTGISLDSYLAEGAGLDEEGSRLAFLGGGGQTTLIALCSYCRPITILNPVYIFRFLAMIISLVLIMYSGYRTALLVTVFSFVISSYFQRRMLDVITMGLIVIPILVLTIAMNGIVFNLPLPAQRALSFLPGHWDYAAKADAEGSTEWRVYMWKAMWYEKKYINNRWLGDGFGYTREQYRAMLRANTTGGTQETFLITGQVHSGPLSAVKFVGIIGFLLYMALLITAAREIWRLILRARGTPYFSAAVFIGIPLIFSVFGFVLIFGGYDGDFPRTLFTVGLIKLLSRGIADYEENKPTEVPELTRTARPELLRT